MDRDIALRIRRAQSRLDAIEGRMSGLPLRNSRTGIGVEYSSYEDVTDRTMGIALLDDGGGDTTHIHISSGIYAGHCASENDGVIAPIPHAWIIPGIAGLQEWDGAPSYIKDSGYFVFNLVIVPGVPVFVRYYFVSFFQEIET